MFWVYVTDHHFASEPAFVLSTISLCVALFITAKQHILRREMKKQRELELKDALDSIIREVQVKNDHIRDTVRFALTHKQIEEFKDEIIKQHKELKTVIESAWNSLQQYTHDDAKKLKWAFTHIRQSHKLMLSSINNRKYDNVLVVTKQIEDACRPFSYVHYGI